MCKGYQRIHKGSWALESCSKNDSKPPLPGSIGTKRDAFWVGLGIFISMKLLRLQMALALTRIRGCGRNMMKGSLQGILAICRELHLCGAGIHWRRTCIHWRKESGMGGRFLPIPSLLLPPNNKEALKPEVFALSCLHPCS
jgi:hypothetical protein